MDTAGSFHEIPASHVARFIHPHAITGHLHDIGSRAVKLWISDRVLVICWAVVLALCINYAVEVAKFHRIQRIASKEQPQIPPKYPSLIPWLGHGLPFAFDNFRFMDRAASYKRKLTSCAVKLFGVDLYILQGSDTVTQMRHDSAVVHAVHVYTYTMKYFFGLPDAGVAAYLRDNTGPERKPRPGSDPNLPACNRIYNITYQGFLKGLTGPALTTTTQRYTRLVTAKLDKKPFSQDQWSTHEDLGAFFQEVVSESILEAIFGPAFLQQNPTFNEDLWVFDRDIPWLARCLPSCILPGAHRRRARLAAQVKRWYDHARQHFSESCIGPDGDADPFWGSELMRYREEKLSAVDDFDDDCKAAADLGFIWATVSNATPSVTWCTSHLFEDASLRDRARRDVARICGNGGGGTTTLDPKMLCHSSPVLNSVFAETLRLHSTMYSMLTARDGDAKLGRWTLPHGQLGLVNTGLSHMDEQVWNTRGGRHPLASFWADRFLIYPNDPTSGPLNQETRAAIMMSSSGESSSSQEYARSTSGEAVTDGEEPIFSLEGLEGSWIPYGAGRHSCPGRVLSKQIIIFTCALMVSRFDIELLEGPVPLDKDTWSFGFNVAVPNRKIPFRIRKRECI
ncbi:cytochrome P450 [Diplogelasinospora grovesii]|uniref:Cytochrome P450 n=1 Tax=Diplogelasinospora grovesii TaxID=303347 RepID=A0AAN6SAL1_9PEZI|nr:cytochrome P450 [Diplogelasinospora grovesii]